MFKYQDLLYTEKVAPTWYSPFSEYGLLLIREVVRDRELGKIDETKANTFLSVYAGFVQEMERKIFEGNKEFTRKFMSIMERNNVPPLPVQYDISDYLSQEYSDKTEQMIIDWKEKTQGLIDKFMHESKGEAPVPSEHMKHKYVKGSENDYDNLLSAVDDMRKEFVNLLHENQLFFAKPRHDNLWIYCGEIDDSDYPDTYQSIQTFVYNKEAWGHAHFDREYAKENKFILDDDEFVVSFKFFTKYDGDKGEATYDDGYANVHFDKNHMPIDMFTHFKDDDMMYQAVAKTFSLYQEIIGTQSLTNQDVIDEAVRRTIAYSYRELGFNFIRTYIMLDLFTLLNTKSSSLPNDEKVVVENAKGVFNKKKATKRFASKYKRKIDNIENFFLMKELVINPFLTNDSTDNGFNKGDGLKKLRVHIRAGHYKVYTADKPRFGRPHKNNMFS